MTSQDSNDSTENMREKITPEIVPSSNNVAENKKTIAIEEIVTIDRDRDLLYSVEEVPPWYLCIILGFQHYLTAFGATISVPLVLAKYFCIAEDKVGLSELISTVFFVSGISTLLQTTVGYARYKFFFLNFNPVNRKTFVSLVFDYRLPIIQGTTFAFLTPTAAILSMPQWKCPYTDEGTRNLTTLPDYGSPEHREMWYSRIREIQGAVMIASLFQVLIGFSGMIGAVLRFIGPLTIVPTIALIGLALFPAAADLASQNWYIALLTMFLIGLFSQYFRNIGLPVCRYEKGKGFGMYRLQIFKLFPILLAMLLAWLICAILTATGAFPDKGWGYEARTDIKTSVINDALWFRFPYPGQWGMPTISAAGVFGMLAGVLASIIESVGDYFACARLAGAPPPPSHAINRGIGIEGIACILAGVWGTGNGTTSYSENIGAIGITKVGSRRVVQTGGIIMLFLGCLGKFGALFVTIPEPVIGGVFMIMFGMITAVGLSNLQFVNLNSTRNLFIIGTSLFFGLSFPVWMKDHADYIKTGNEVVNQVISVLLSTSMFVGGFIGFVLDNTLPGTVEERGINNWRKQRSTMGYEDDTTPDCLYDLPLVQKYLDRILCTKLLPFCPNFDINACCNCKTRSTSKDLVNGKQNNELII